MVRGQLAEIGKIANDKVCIIITVQIKPSVRIIKSVP